MILCKHAHAPFFVFSFLVAALLILPACTPEHSSSSLSRAGMHTADNSTQFGVTVRAKKLNKHEAQRVLGTRASKLFSNSKPIVPIAYTIENNSLNTIAFERSDIDLPLVSTNVVKKRMQYNRFWRVFGTFVTGFFAIPNILLNVGDRIFNKSDHHTRSAWDNDPRPESAPHQALVGMAATSIISQLATPFITYFYNKRLKKANKEIEFDIMNKTIIDSCIIAPGKKKHYLLYAYGNLLPDQCDMNIKDLSNNRTLSFAINLDEQADTKLQELNVSDVIKSVEYC